MKEILYSSESKVQENYPLALSYDGKPVAEQNSTVEPWKLFASDSVLFHFRDIELDLLMATDSKYLLRLGQASLFTFWNIAVLTHTALPPKSSIAISKCFAMHARTVVNWKSNIFLGHLNQA